MSKAKDNERKFRDLFSKQFDGTFLQQPQPYKNQDVDVSISVDAFLEVDGKKVLFEIDSGNYAKLLVGQYVLLNEIIDDCKNQLFVIVHYYRNYNEERTIKNLKFINESIYGGKGLQFKVYTAATFEAEIQRYGSLTDFVEALYT